MTRRNPTKVEAALLTIECRACSVPAQHWCRVIRFWKAGKGTKLALELHATRLNEAHDRGLLPLAEPTTGSTVAS
jgi:hypothetical protein